MAMERALDVSNYSGVFSREAVACWRQQGYGHLVCGSQRSEITRRQLETAVAGGMSVDAYVYLYWRFDVAGQVAAALETVRGYPVERLWLDCEDAAGGLAPAAIVGRIGTAVAACGAFPHGIYTGRWWWEPTTGASRAFSHLPLWHAEYPVVSEPPPDFAGFRAYGGWSRPAMWQYRGTTQLCGVGVDLNQREVLAAVDRAPLTPDERRELDGLRAGRRFQQALHAGRYAFRPASGRRDAVELVRVEAGRPLPLEPPSIVVVD